MPLFAGRDGKTVELAFGISQLDSIPICEISVIRHGCILGQILSASAGMLQHVSNQPLRLSPSRVSEFENCPQLYKYRAIDQLPQPPSLDAERGTLVHTVLHDLFESPAVDRTPQQAIDLLPSRWRAQLENKPELMEMITNEKEWLDRAGALLHAYFTLEDPKSFDATFRELHLENDFSPTVYLHGYVDRLDVAPTGEVRIVDYKTGKAPKPGWEEKALFQLRVYALLYFKTHNVLPRLLQLIYLGDGKVVKNIPTLSDLASTEKTLNRVARDIFASIEKQYWPPKPSRLCDWCYFKSICPAHTN